jgi:hypothetical protein
MLNLINFNDNYKIITVIENNRLYVIFNFLILCKEII